MRAIVVGAGGITRELLRRLGEAWEVSVVDISEERLARLNDAQEFLAVEGDGTSRLVLERAGLEEADAVVAVTGDDDANLEVCRIAGLAGVLRIVAVARNLDRLPDYRKRNVRVFSPDTLVARRLELTLEHRRVSSSAFADGRAEAIEFQLSHDSPMVRKPVREISSGNWIIGAVLRGDQVIIPHGNTVLQPEDRVTVVGAGADFSQIVRAFTGGEARFPLDFGKRVLVALETEGDLAGAVDEAGNFVRNSAAASLLLVHRDPASVREEETAGEIRLMLERAGRKLEGIEVHMRGVQDSSPRRAAARLCGLESVGLVVIPASQRQGFFGRLEARRAVALARQVQVPVLIARGTHPYRKILVPARQTLAGRAAVRAAVDLARFAGAQLTGLAVVDPLFAARPNAEETAREEIGWLRQEASTQQVSAQGFIQRGNPVIAFVAAESNADLIVLGVARGATKRFRVSITMHVAERSCRSVLIVPVRG